MFELRKADKRGLTQLPWLRSWHTFSFGGYQEPNQVGFSDLRVINDDTVLPAGGFDTHPHRDMEIFTYVLQGSLEHKDSMGTGSIIRPGDVQIMSAGTGVLHSEFNHSKTEAVHLLQIWIVPNRGGVKPRYQQAHFEESEKRGKLKLIISPAGASNSLSIYQDAKVYCGQLKGAECFEHALAPDRFAYVHVARGRLTLNDNALSEGDGVRVRKEAKINFSDGKDAEVLLFDLAGKELPDFE